MRDASTSDDRRTRVRCVEHLTDFLREILLAIGLVEERDTGIEAAPLADSHAGPCDVLLPSVIPASTGLLAAGLPPLP